MTTNVSQKKKVCVVVPALNEETTLPKVLASLRGRVESVIVVDDGSEDGTERVAKEGGAILIRHIINRGLGAALGTGIEAALFVGADYVVTFDADGQHKSEDISRLVAAAEEGKYDAVIGSRLINPAGMPLARRLANRIGNAATFILFGLWVTDSQSGLRLFRADAARRLRLKSNRMEVSSEFIKEIRRLGLRFREIPIEAVYTEYSLSKGQSFVVGLKTLFQLILQRWGK